MASPVVFKAGITKCLVAGRLLAHSTGLPSYPAASVPFGVLRRSMCSSTLGRESWGYDEFCNEALKLCRGWAL